MKTIAILAANGKVGAEVSLFLSLRNDVRVVPISRSRYGSTLLRRCGLPFRQGSFDSAAEVRALTEGCDVVVDCSVPVGSPPEIRKTMAKIITNGVRHSPHASQFVYMSSNSVYRQRIEQAPYRSYAIAKRYAERLAFRLGREAGKKTYVLRLGEVHGVLQDVSHQYRAGIRDEEAVLPDIPSYTVFAFSVAEALVNIAYGREREGRYTLTSVPAWSWMDVHEYYCRQAGVEPRARMVSAGLPGPAERLKRLVGKVVSPVWALALHHREFLDDMCSTFAPRLAQNQRAKYYIQRARQEINERDRLAWRPALQNRYVPGARLRSLSDSRLTMHEPTEAVKRLIDSALFSR